MFCDGGGVDRSIKMESLSAIPTCFQLVILSEFIVWYQLSFYKSSMLHCYHAIWYCMTVSLATHIHLYPTVLPVFSGVVGGGSVTTFGCLMATVSEGGCLVAGLVGRRAGGPESIGQSVHYITVLHQQGTYLSLHWVYLVVV